jgi:hypothetical protein
MNESLTETTKHFPICASLKVRELDLFGPIRKSVKVAQKIVEYLVQKECVHGSDAMAQRASFVE